MTLVEGKATGLFTLHHKGNFQGEKEKARRETETFACSRVAEASERDFSGTFLIPDVAELYC